MKYRVMVLAHGERDYVGNGLLFDTPEKAEAYGADLFARWTACDDYKVVEVEEVADESQNK